jgi:hypothetical protein
LCLGFVGCASTLPYWASKTIGNLTERDGALTQAQIRRGAFQNSGSRDAGKDPNWDWKNGRYNYSEGFQKHLEVNSNPNDTDLGPVGLLGEAVKEQQQQRK